MIEAIVEMGSEEAPLLLPAPGVATCVAELLTAAGMAETEER